ncbi:MAG TPA: hypothetical protein PKZ92_03680 [Candidatus Woesebacteria bacterium]|jgi:hypothetical protein|nr:hypothetical protein [Candidatus Shapirobacteria bacterium]HOR02328.1 hypothetical protein [Candidatus Woesebacteria bacterium]
MLETGASLNELNLGQERLTRPVEFEMADLLFLEKNNMGLRHVSVKKEAEKNASEGFVGDAVVLGNIGRVFLKENQGIFVNNDEAKKVLDIFKAYDVSPDLERMVKFFGSEEENKIIELMHDRTVSFIKDALNVGNLFQTSEGEVVGEVMDKLKEASAFILVSGGENNSGGGYDNEPYYGLGKFGKRKFDSKDVLGLICGDEVVTKLQGQNVDLTAKVDESFFDKTAEVYYGLIVGKVKEERISKGV